MEQEKKRETSLHLAGCLNTFKKPEVLKAKSENVGLWF